MKSLDIIQFISGRIVGGSEAYPHKWKWQGALLLRGRFHCGGALLSNNLFVTAAHCVVNNWGGVRPIREFTVVMGEHDR